MRMQARNNKHHFVSIPRWEGVAPECVQKACQHVYVDAHSLFVQQPYRSVHDRNTYDGAVVTTC